MSKFLLMIDKMLTFAAIFNQISTGFARPADVSRAVLPNKYG